MTRPYEISVITPSYNMLGYLKRCVASVADQTGAAFEHIVVDGASQDGTAAWVATNRNLKSINEPDNGMYEAINKGLKMANGEILAYLNCDEQYLPGTLSAVCEYFKKHPDVDVLFGDMLLVQPDGSLIAYRKAFKPRLGYILSSYLYVYTCTMFFRRRIVDDGHFFKENLKGIGDLEFVSRLIRHGYRCAHLKRYLSVFTITGQNLCINNQSFSEEKRNFDQSQPAWTRVLKYPLNVLRLIEKVLRGAYFQKMPLVYALYDDNDLTRRKQIRVVQASYSVKGIMTAP